MGDVVLGAFIHGGWVLPGGAVARPLPPELGILADILVIILLVLLAVALRRLAAALGLLPSLLRGDILAMRPADLGQVEKELHKPRAAIYWKGLGTDAAARVAGYEAVRGWVVQVKETRDYEGPDFKVWIAYEVGEKLHQLYFSVGYDGYHWACGSPDHCEWFSKTMKAGRSLTVLYDPWEPDQAVIFGMAEPFVTVDGERRWAAR
jgi:hypothetical protein